MPPTDGGLREVSIADIAARAPHAVVGGPFGSELRTRDYTPSGVPVIRGENMRARWVRGPFVFVSEEKALQLSANVARPWDVVVTQRGTLGQVALIPGDEFERYIVSQSQMKITVDREVADPVFIYYVLRSSKQQRHMTRSAVQAGVPHTNLGQLRSTRIGLPPLKEQREVARTLGAFDDKIELNLQMNDTLEALARAVFEQRVMARAREALPEGWTQATLGEHLEVTRGLSYKGSGLVKEGGLPLHNLDSVKEGGGYKRSGIKRYTGEYRERHLVRPGEVVVANTEQGHDELLIGCPAIVPRAFGEFGLFSQDLSRVVPKADSPLTPRFVYLLLANERVRRTVAAYANGTTVNHLPREALERPTFPLPPPAVIAEVDALVAPLLERIEANEDENATLTELRDALLPGLVSGRIRVDGVREPD